MNKRWLTAAVAAAALGGLPATSMADAWERGFYFGVFGGANSWDLGVSKQELDALELAELEGRLADEGFAFASTPTSRLDDSDKTWGVTIGYRFIPWFAAEIGYIHLGKTGYIAEVQGIDPLDPAAVAFDIEESLRLKSAGITVAGVGMLPLGEKFDLHAKAGLYFSQTDLRDRSLVEEAGMNAYHSEARSSSSDLMFGAGASWNINESYSLRFEYLHLSKVGDGDVGEIDIDSINLGVLFR